MWNLWNWNALDENGKVLGTISVISSHEPEVDQDQAFFAALDNWKETVSVVLSNETAQINAT